MFFLLKGLLLVCFADHCYGQATTHYDCLPQATPKSSYLITCHISGSLLSGIIWIRPDANPVVSCSAADSRSCLPSFAGYTVQVANASLNILTITTVTELDEGKWICRDGASGPAGCTIVASDLPADSSVTLDPRRALKSGDTLTITVEAIMYYCSQSVSFKLSLNNVKNLSLSMPASNSQFVNGSDVVTTTVTKDMNGPMKLLMECDGQLLGPGIPSGNLSIATPTTPSPPPRGSSTATTEPLSPTESSTATTEPLSSTETCSCLDCPVWYRKITRANCTCECWINIQLTVLVLVVVPVVLLITVIIVFRIVVFFRNRESMHHSHQPRDNNRQQEHKFGVATFQSGFGKSFHHKHSLLYS